MTRILVGRSKHGTFYVIDGEPRVSAMHFSEDPALPCLVREDGYIEALRRLARLGGFL